MANLQCTQCKSEKFHHNYSLQDDVIINKDTMELTVTSTTPISPEDPFNLSDHLFCAECGLEVEE